MQAHSKPLSKHSYLLDVNRESRTEAAKVYVQSQVSAHKCSAHEHNTIFANLANDILWFPDNSEVLGDFAASMGMELSQSKVPEARPICRLAVQHAAWTETYPWPMFYHATPLHRSIMIFMHTAANLGLREIILVVDDTTTTRSTNVVFTAPKNTPVVSGIRQEFIERLGIGHDCSWKDLETSTNQFTIDIHEKRLKEKRRLLSSGGY